MTERNECIIIVYIRNGNRAISGVFEKGAIKVKKTYSIDFCGQEYAWKNAKESYLPGETVTLYYYMIATDTNYSFFLDEEWLYTNYETGKGFIITFTMPDHDVSLKVVEKNSMLREMR